MGAFCSTFDPHLTVFGLENQFLVFLRKAVLHRFNCSVKPLNKQNPGYNNDDSYVYNDRNIIKQAL